LDEKDGLVAATDGLVRNLPNGSVEAVFEGRDEQVELMVRRCAAGPPLADVTVITTREEAYRGEFTGFVIRYD